MRIAAAVVILLLAGCRRETKVAPTPEAATPIAVDASLPAEPPPKPAEPIRPLPSEATLRAIFKGTSARGVVAVTVDGQRESFAVPSGEAMPDRPLLVASFTKLWIAVTTLRFVARKEFGLDDEIKALVPELEAKPWADSTVRELLGHTSRVPEFENGFFTRADIDFTHAAATLAKELSAATEKRGTWKYRNSEYAILGAVLEAKSGAKAGAVLEKEVFTPAGMKHAGLVVKGRPADVDFVPMGRVRPENFFTAGNGYSSVNDLLAFFEALDKDVLLEAGSKKLLFEGNPRHDRAALGCWAYDYPSADGGTTLLVERPGSFGNVKLVTAFSPEQRRAIVFWTGEPLEVGKPRTKNSVASKLAHALLE
jgi:CubicO group peptidase (beta-lactamase class C family)